MDYICGLQVLEQASPDQQRDVHPLKPGSQTNATNNNNSRPTARWIHTAT
jgi:hypothetical protein